MTSGTLLLKPHVSRAKFPNWGLLCYSYGPHFLLRKLPASFSKKKIPMFSPDHNEHQIGHNWDVFFAKQLFMSLLSTNYGSFAYLWNNRGGNEPLSWRWLILRNWHSLLVVHRSNKWTLFSVDGLLTEVVESIALCKHRDVNLYWEYDEEWLLSSCARWLRSLNSRPHFREKTRCLFLNNHYELMSFV